MQTELNTFPLSPLLRSKLVNCGFRVVEDVVTLKPSELSAGKVKCWAVWWLGCSTVFFALLPVNPRSLSSLGFFAPWLICPSPWRVRLLACLPSGLFAPWLICPEDYIYRENSRKISKHFRYLPWKSISTKIATVYFFLFSVNTVNY